MPVVSFQTTQFIGLDTTVSKRRNIEWAWFATVEPHDFRVFTVFIRRLDVLEVA